MNVTTRTAAAPGRQGARTARGGRTAGLQPTARSLQNTLGRPSGYVVLGFEFYSFRYIRCSSTELLNEVMQTRPRTQAPDAVRTHTTHRVVKL